MEVISPFFFEDNKRINCLFSSINLLKILLPELQNYSSIYYLFSNFLNELKFNKNWIVHYIFWEMSLLKEIGFDLNLMSSLVSDANTNKKMTTVLIDKEKINIPFFLVEKNFENIDTKSIYSALKFIGKFIEKKTLIPNNLNHPASRKKLESYFKK